MQGHYQRQNNFVDQTDQKTRNRSSSNIKQRNSGKHNKEDEEQSNSSNVILNLRTEDSEMGGVDDELKKVLQASVLSSS